VGVGLCKNCKKRKIRSQFQSWTFKKCKYSLNTIVFKIFSKFMIFYDIGEKY
jgi:hypothetical protein